MTTITVNGTSIQTAVNAAAASGDTVDVKGSGGYAKFVIPTGKKVDVIAADQAKVIGTGTTIEVRGAGSKVAGFDVSGSTGIHSSCVLVTNVADVVLDHMTVHDGECYGIRGYGAGVLRLKIIDPLIHHVAAGIRFDSGGAGSVIDRPVISDTDRMVVNDTTADNDNGGNSFQFVKSTGPIEINQPMLSRAFSIARLGKPASYDYGWDGGFIELFGAKGVHVNGPGEFRGGVNIVETGRNSTSGDCSDFTMKGIKVWGFRPEPTQDYLKAANGILLRTMVGARIEDCEFRDIDWWLLNFLSGGGFGGTVSGIVFQRNKVWLKPGVNRLIHFGSGVPLTALTMDQNQVDPNGSTEVAFVAGKGGTTSKTTLTSWTGWEASSTWGPIGVPADPCDAVEAERDALAASLAAANAALLASDAAVLARTVERDSFAGKLDQAKQNALETLAL